MCWIDYRSAHLINVTDSNPNTCKRTPVLFSTVSVFDAMMTAYGLWLLCVFTLQKETPLANAVFWAARKGNLALLQLLLNSGRVDADCRDSVGRCMSQLLGCTLYP